MKLLEAWMPCVLSFTEIGPLHYPILCPSVRAIIVNLRLERPKSYLFTFLTWCCSVWRFISLVILCLLNTEMVSEATRFVFLRLKCLKCTNVLTRRHCRLTWSVWKFLSLECSTDWHWVSLVNRLADITRWLALLVVLFARLDNRQNVLRACFATGR